MQLAAALVGDPMLLVLDAPFAGLDPLAIDTLGGLTAGLAPLHQLAGIRVNCVCSSLVDLPSSASPM